MLTKDLIRYRIRSGKIVPEFIDPKNPELLAYADILISAFQRGDGKTYTEIGAELEDEELGHHPLKPGFLKLLSDRCVEETDDPEVPEKRWEMITKAQILRSTQNFPNLIAFQYELAKQSHSDIDTLRFHLYSDLPECRKVTGFESLSSEALLHRYNCALIQGLLIHSVDLKVSFQADLSAKRQFFRCLKFQRLMVDVLEAPSGLTLTLSGPLKIFQNTQSYGLRLANFFPYILHLPKWQLQAEIKLKNKYLNLSLNQNVAIKSHYRELTPFVPTELTAFLDTFNERDYGWKARIGTDYLHLGRQSYCCPDVSLKSSMGAEAHIELFHRWHAGALIHRLETMRTHPSLELILGVSEDLRADSKVDEAIKQSEWFNRQGFTFKSFPTPKAVMGALIRKG